MNRKEPANSRLREIDALFALGGLEHSPHRTSVPPVERGRSKKPKESFARHGHLAAEHTPGVVTALTVLRVPDWKQYPWLAHGFSTRTGGVSTAYRPADKRGELNLGMTAADSPKNVEKNRELFLRAVLDCNNARQALPRLVLARQIHSGIVHRGENAQSGKILRGDGWIAADPGLLLGIQTADCIPVLVADVRQRIVAAFHAGWRGTLARIVERGVGRMRAEFGSRPGDLTAAIGPGIGRCCYSVGEEVLMEFQSQFAYADDLFEEVFDLDPVKQKYPMLFLTARAPGHSNLGPSIHLGLPEASRRQLLAAGLQPENIHALNICTACNTDRFFSHRAEQGFTGRMLSVIGVVQNETASQADSGL